MLHVLLDSFIALLASNYFDATDRSMDEWMDGRDVFLLGLSLP
jgi:hypothetical protein